MVESHTRERGAEREKINDKTKLGMNTCEILVGYLAALGAQFDLYVHKRYCCLGFLEAGKERYCCLQPWISRGR